MTKKHDSAMYRTLLVKAVAMDVVDFFPPDGYIQHLYCSKCGTYLDLEFKSFCEFVSGVTMEIGGLPILRCPDCGEEYLPDHSRISVIELHRRAIKDGKSAVRVTRQKVPKDFGFTDVPFVYDADDYRLIPGLERPWDEGFLTPVFFNRRVLLKYDTAPGCRLSFASTSYGTIEPDGEGYISFGINRFGKVVMWLGDIAKLPEAEQYYLRSENVPSDHSIGSEFYDGQIECKFTEPPVEKALFKARSEFVDGCAELFGIKIAHLNEEVLELSAAFNAPSVDTPKERRHVVDTLNKIHLESLANTSLGEIMRSKRLDAGRLGSLKRLQAILGAEFPSANVPALLMPFFVLYDLRVAYSHLTSGVHAQMTLKSATDRLGLSEGAMFPDIYDSLVATMLSSYNSFLSYLPKVSRVER